MRLSTRGRSPEAGNFPCAFVAALPSDIPIGVEVPLQSLAERGVGPFERARLAVEATRRIIAEARAGFVAYGEVTQLDLTASRCTGRPCGANEALR